MCGENGNSAISELPFSNILRLLVILTVGVNGCCSFIAPPFCHGLLPCVLTALSRLSPIVKFGQPGDFSVFSLQFLYPHRRSLVVFVELPYFVLMPANKTQFFIIRKRRRITLT
jgi:hypothetical protein